MLRAGLLLCLSAFTNLQTQQPQYGFDRNNIRWVLPASFPEALARAKNEKRILLIKGIAFNIDEAGAKCATKGHW